MVNGTVTAHQLIIFFNDLQLIFTHDLQLIQTTDMLSTCRWMLLRMIEIVYFLMWVRYLSCNPDFLRPPPGPFTGQSVAQSFELCLEYSCPHPLLALHPAPGQGSTSGVETSLPCPSAFGLIPCQPSCIQVPHDFYNREGMLSFYKKLSIT